MPWHLSHLDGTGAYGGRVTRSNLAMAALASAAVPGMKPVAAASITPVSTLSGEESVHDLALVEDTTGRRWFVKAPRTAAAGAMLEPVDELVRQLPRHVPFKVPAVVGYAALRSGPVRGRAAVYPYIEGVSVDFSRLPAGLGLASAIGRVLAAIHNIPPIVFEEQDVPVFDATGVRQRMIAVVDRAAETGRVPTGLLARWEEAFEAPALWQFATTGVHGSFGGASVLVTFTDDQDAASGRVVAVTGWREAQIADPAVDFAELYTHASEEAWDAVLDSYTLARAQRPDPYLKARARLISEVQRLNHLARYVQEGDESAAQQIVESLRRLDRLTEAEDSLVPVSARGVGAVPAAHVDDASQEAEQDAHMFPASTEEVAPETSADVTMDVPALFSQQSPQPEDLTDDPDPHLGESTDEHGPGAEDLMAGPVGADPSDVMPDQSDQSDTEQEAPQSDEVMDDPLPDEADSGVEEGSPASLDDAERLHELYGMPDDATDAGRAQG